MSGSFWVEEGLGCVYACAHVVVHDKENTPRLKPIHLHTPIPIQNEQNKPKPTQPRRGRCTC